MDEILLMSMICYKRREEKRGVLRSEVLSIGKQFESPLGTRDGRGEMEIYWPGHSTQARGLFTPSSHQNQKRTKHEGGAEDLTRKTNASEATYLLTTTMVRSRRDRESMAEPVW
jgi:hypothetical protein